MSNPIARLNAALSARYSIERELGVGGMATVYLADDLRHERKVALKVLKPELAAVVGAERFLAEIKTTANLQHPHILPLHDSGEADSFLFYVMPYVEGESLRERLDREKQLPIDDAVGITTALAGALDHAHRHGVIHRDIKPENILLQDGQPTLADFGIALAVRAAGGTRLTETGMFLGTPHYMSPEQAMGDRELDARSDVYSLACVTYEMLVGEPPHTGPTAQAVVAKVLTEPPSQIALGRPTVPPQVDAAVHRALEKLPADRFGTAREFAEALTDVRMALAAASFPPSGAEPAVVESRKSIDQTFELTAEVCRKLNRDMLDARIIGDHQHYLDNQVESDVLVVYHHGMGLDQREFVAVLNHSPYRGIAPTLYGFEPHARRRLRVSLPDHVTLQRELLADLIRREAPATVVMVGFSSGADLGFQLLAEPLDTPHQVDGFLSLDCNVSRDTCFASGRIASVSEDREQLLRELVAFGDTASTLSEWLNVHDYLVKVFRKFRGDVDPLRVFAADVVRPFEGDETPFIGWYRTASKSLRALRCVFSDTDMYNRGVARLKLEHVDTGMLGEQYDEASLVTEPDADHFELVELDRLMGHVEAVVGAARAG